jgi:hypothetical protein
VSATSPQYSFAEICDHIVGYHANRGTSGSKCVLVRPGSHGFIETNEDDIAAIVDVIRKQPMTGIPFNPLERLAFRLLVESMGMDPWTGEYKR